MENAMSTVEAIAEMMANWSKIETAAKIQFPDAADEKIYLITKAVMDCSLGL